MKPHGIKVTSVLPGATYTDSWKSTGISADRFMKVDDIAKMIYAASQLSPQACVEDIIIRPQLGDSKPTTKPKWNAATRTLFMLFVLQLPLF